MENVSIYQNAVYIYKKVNRFNKNYKYKLILTLFLKLLIPIFATFIPAIVIYLIMNQFDIMRFVIVVGLIVFVYAAINYLNTYYSFLVSPGNTFIRTNAFFGTISQKGMTTGYENMEFEAGREKLMKAVSSLRTSWVGVELLLRRVPMLITSCVGLLLYSTYILTIDSSIVIVLIGMTIVNLLLSTYARYYEKRNEEELNSYRTKLKYYQDEANKLTNAKDIRIYKLEDWFYQGIKFCTKKFSKTVMKHKYRYSLSKFSDSIFSIVRDVLAYTILITMVVDGDITVIGFAFMIGIVTGFSVWLNQLSDSFGGLKEANIRINYFRQYIAMDDGINKIAIEDVEPLLSKMISIEFKNVSFTYPKASKPTISNLNLTINAGEKIALVGINGAGKTTIVKLLTGLYQPSEGEILINGISSAKFNIYEYYKLFGVIFQDVNILSFTIAQNISCRTDEETNFKKINKVIKQSGLGEKVASLPLKEHTYLTQVINQDGIMLSGGELQKLMLARTLYKNAPILVLDEPTAALDPLAEQELYLQYNSLTAKKTSIFISHRLSSTHFCNKIIFLEDGKILEMGSHHELMNRNGKYAEMFAIQSQYYKENTKEEAENDK